jgi:uncharacterized protein
MLVGFALAGRILNREDLLKTARANANFILQRMRRDGKLLRVYKDGQSKIPGYLEDYANFIEGLLTLYEVTGESNWLDSAEELTGLLLEQFWDPNESCFYLTGKDHESLITRVKDFYDNATPAGNSVAVLNLLRLSILSGNKSYREIAETNLSSMSSALTQYPGGFGYLLLGLDFVVGPVKEFAVVGDMEDLRTRELLHTIFQVFLPNKVLAFTSGKETTERNTFPLMEGKMLVNGNPAVYICEDYTCKAPVNSKEELKSLIRRSVPAQ